MIQPWMNSLWGQLEYPDSEEVPFVPEKKFRNRRRQFRRIASEVSSYKLNWGDGSFDFWHEHLDWTGDGNRGPVERRVYARPHIDLLREINRQALRHNPNAQVWLILDPFDSSQDAVYVHSRKSNETPFPYDFEGVIWGIDPPPAVRGFDLSGLEFGRSSDRWTLFWVRIVGE
jgi:hypothetical protein